MRHEVPTCEAQAIRLLGTSTAGRPAGVHVPVPARCALRSDAPRDRSHGRRPGQGQAPPKPPGLLGRETKKPSRRFDPECSAAMARLSFCRRPRARMCAREGEGGSDAAAGSPGPRAPPRRFAIALAGPGRQTRSSQGRWRPGRRVYGGSPCHQAGHRPPWTPPASRIMQCNAATPLASLGVFRAHMTSCLAMTVHGTLHSPDDGRHNEVERICSEDMIPSVCLDTWE